MFFKKKVKKKIIVTKERIKKNIFNVVSKTLNPKS